MGINLAALCLYTRSRERWLKITFAVAVLMFGFIGLHLVYVFMSAKNPPLSLIQQNMLIFAFSVLSGSLGINLLTAALEYSKGRERVIDYLDVRLAKREKCNRERLQVNIYRAEAEYLKWQNLQAFDPQI